MDILKERRYQPEVHRSWDEDKLQEGRNLMTVELSDGRYEIVTSTGTHLLTDLDGAVVVVPKGSAPLDHQIWEVNAAEDGSLTLRCVGTSNYLAMTETNGVYYKSGGEAAAWRVAPALSKFGGYNLIREMNGKKNALWLNGLPVTPTAATLQGVAVDPVPATWTFSPAGDCGASEKTSP